MRPSMNGSTRTSPNWAGEPQARAQMSRFLVAATEVVNPAQTVRGVNPPMPAMLRDVRANRGISLRHGVVDSAGRRLGGTCQAG